MHGSLPLKSRAFWLRQMRQWHWISAAVCLIGMLVFALTAGSTAACLIISTIG